MKMVEKMVLGICPVNIENFRTFDQVGSKLWGHRKEENLRIVKKDMPKTTRKTEKCFCQMYSLIWKLETKLLLLITPNIIKTSNMLKQQEHNRLLSRQMFHQWATNKTLHQLIILLEDQMVIQALKFHRGL